MGTSAKITVILKNKTYKSSCVHYDGYISDAGVKLFVYYNDFNKISKLIDLGDLSQLAENIEPPNGMVQDFDNRIKKVCVFYNRDRGERLNIERGLEQHLRNDFEYNYVFKEKTNKWYIYDKKERKLFPLINEMKKIDLNKENLNDNMRDLKIILEKIKLEQKLKKMENKQKIEQINKI